MSSLAEILGGESAAYKLLMQKMMTSIRVSMPATIVSFDPASQTATVQPSIDDNVIINGKQTWVSLKPIENVPVQFPRGGPWSLTLPVKPGDVCELLFQDSCMDGFYQSGTQSTQVEVRHHDLSDAVALIGFSTGNAPVPGYSPDNMELRHQTAPIKISLADESVNIQHSGSNVNVASGSIGIKSGAVGINASVAITGSLTVNGRNVLLE